MKSIKHIKADLKQKGITIENSLKKVKNMEEITEETFLCVLINYEKQKDVLKSLAKIENEKLKFLFLKYIELIFMIKQKNNENNYFEFLTWEQISYLLLEYTSEKFYRKMKEDFLKNKDYIEYFFHHLDLVKDEDLFRYLNALKDSPYFEEIFLKNKEKFYEKWINREVKEKDLLNTIIIIVEDALRKAEKKLTDVIYLDKGTQKITYKVGDYIIQFGKEGFCKTIPNDSNVLYPMCRKYMEELNLSITITSLGERNNISMEDVKDVYKRVREEKHVWLDAKKDNLVKLLKDNNSYGFIVEPYTIGFVGENTAQERKQGECVICDLDLLHQEENLPIETLLEKGWGGYNNYKKLEEEYLKKFLKH